MIIFTRKNTPKLLHPYLDELNHLYDLYFKVMDLKRSRDLLTKWERLKAYPFVLYAYYMDIRFNLFTATKMFKDRPKELTFTARLKRYRTGTKEQQGISELLCDTYLDKVDPSGDHC